MNALCTKLGDLVKGVIHGFDRIVFKGCLRPLMYQEGVTSFLQSRKIKHTEYGHWARDQTDQILEDAKQLSQATFGHPVIEIKSSSEKKEALARERKETLGIDAGLIGVYWAMEMCNTFKARFDPGQSRPAIRPTATKCKHLYYYFDHSQFGLMHVRLQTWFPFGIQIAMNGREWLYRSLEQAGIGFERHRNKLLTVDDMVATQRLLDEQLDAEWPSLLGQFVPTVFPAFESILGPHLSYYWTLWQSEWASDYIFRDPRSVATVGHDLIEHAFRTGTGHRILRYLDRPMTRAGEPYQSNTNDVSSRLMIFQDGCRVRHYVDHNSVKAYTEQNVLRIETTINDPAMFKAMRNKEGDGADDPKTLLPLRKGVADTPLRAQVSQQINDRMADQLAEAQSSTTVEEAVAPLCQRRTKKGRVIRSLDLLGKDRGLVCILCDPSFAINGLTNRMLRERLTGYVKGLTEKQAGAKVSRLLRLLRDHGLIAKLPRQRRYRVSRKGVKITTLLAATLQASTQELTGKAA